MRKLFLGLLAVLFLASTLTYSQEGVASIYGTVMDDTGTPLPGVSITLTGERIGKLTATTTAGGYFRFLSLPIGSFELRLELQGFKTEVQTIILSAGDRPDLRITMKQGTIQEEVTVVAPSALVSTKKATISSTLTKEQYQSLPAGKSMTGILDLVPGILIDATDVGLSQYGQEIVGMGANRNNSTYIMDGGDVSSARFSGKVGATMNMNAIEEVEVTQGAQDIEAQAAGFQVNFVTKRGGNRVSGDFYTYVEDRDFEFKKSLPSDITSVNPKYVTPGINNVSQYGFDIGGPVIRDHFWFFGAYNAQNTRTRTIKGDEQRGFGPSYFGKLNFQYKNTTLGFQFQSNKNTTYFNIWTDPSYFDQTCVWDTQAPTKVYLAELQHIMGSLILNFRYSFMNSGSVDVPRGSTLDNGQGQGPYSLKKTMYSDTDFWVVINGTTNVLYQGTLPWWEDTNQRKDYKGSANYFADKLLGGSHEIKFGSEFDDGAYLPQDIYPNHRLVYILKPGDPPNGPRNTNIQKYDNNYDAFMAYTPNIGNIHDRRLNFYLQDTATYKRFTFNLGMRVDKIWFHFGETVGAGYLQRRFGAPQGVADPVPEWAPYLGDLKVNAYDIKSMPAVFSPRVSVNYDVFGNGKTVAKLTTALYGPKLEGNRGGSFWPLSFRSIEVPFWDLNGNYIPDLGEFDPLTPFEIDALKANPPAGSTWTGWMGYGGFNKFDPTQTTSTTKYASDYKNPTTWELTLTAEHELRPNLAVSISGIYKRTFNDEQGLTYYPDGHVNTGSDYVVVAQDSETGQYIFANSLGGGVGTILTNYAKNHNVYKGILLELKKRLSNRWMTNFSLVVQDWKNKNYLDEALVPAGYKPTNWDYYHDAPYALGALNEGYTINSRWIIKWNGLFVLPLNINLTWNLRVREGYPVDRGYPVKNFFGAYLYDPNTRYGDDRLPTNYYLNLGAEKVFQLGENFRASVFLYFFNATNHLNVEKTEWRPGAGQKKIINVSNPGIVQFGGRFTF
jgi:hypothetical protein